MSRIKNIFRQRKHPALIGYVTVGYPSIEYTLRVVPLLAQSGCDIVELGVPFSDPLADGATIQKASYHALKNGVNLQLCIDIAKQLSEKVDIPLIFMSYLNPVLSYGIENFCRNTVDANVDGVIIPDLPPDESLNLESIAFNHGLDIIYLLAPTSTDKRIELVARKSRGFIYLVSVTGVTGTRQELPQYLETFVNKVRKIALQPLCLGFGIANAAQAKRVAAIADGVIVGSKIIELMQLDDKMSEVQNFIQDLRNVIDEYN
ncbi:MAG: tryptophan synthase subunit alpha [Dehalococcoidales bacterium]|nr:tryptophan synthase subunit alpha [Dehalococcoidales bacterium]